MIGRLTDSLLDVLLWCGIYVVALAAIVAVILGGDWVLTEIKLRAVLRGPNGPDDRPAPRRLALPPARRAVPLPASLCDLPLVVDVQPINLDEL